jgi:FkbH-like protein
MRHSGECPILDLPWLERPTVQDRERLASAANDSAEETVVNFRKLLTRGWGEAELHSIGRKIRRLLRSGSADPDKIAQNSACVRLSLLIVSSSTVSHLVDALTASALRVGILLDCSFVEYEEPETWLSENRERLAASPPGATLLILDRRSLQLQPCIGDAAGAAMRIASALDRVKRIAEGLHAATGRTVIIETLAADASDAQLSMDAWLEGSSRRVLAEFNLQLTNYARARSFPLFDAAAIADIVGISQWSPARYRYVAKLPFAPICIALYTYRLCQLLAAMVGKSKRVLVLDLDNTLWGGVIGDDGIEGVVLGAGSPHGETYLAVQRLALEYKQRGIILCIASKNTEAIAREAFRAHPEMLLREEDITLFQINWLSKVENISAMADSLDLGLESFVFVDDNPVERKEVRDFLPMVAVPELPDDPASWVPTIQAAAYFEQTSLSAEDLSRTEYYKGNALRNVHAATVGNHQDFLKSLQMVLTAAPFDTTGRQRIGQLIAKSNQFNLTTRRYSESEVAAMSSSADFATLQIRLKDIFGDNGMISVVICRKHTAAWEIDTWIMSCRVLGRGVERATLKILVDLARAHGVTELRGKYLPTAKNGIVRDHYAKLGFDRMETSGDETHWRLALNDFAAEELPIEVQTQCASFVDGSRVKC